MIAQDKTNTNLTNKMVSVIQYTSRDHQTSTHLIVIVIVVDARPLLVAAHRHRDRHALRNAQALRAHLRARNCPTLAGRLLAGVVRIGLLHIGHVAVAVLHHRMEAAGADIGWRCDGCERHAVHFEEERIDGLLDDAAAAVGLGHGDGGWLGKAERGL